MKRKSVTSTNIRSIGYEPSSQTLEVEFNSGKVYQYYDVPEDEYDGLMNASSHGKYLNQHIKGVYQYLEV